MARHSPPDPAKYVAATAQPRGIGADARCPALDGDVAELYTAVADDGQLSAKKREAAVLLVVAEGHLDDDEDSEEALRTGREALTIFQSLGDRDALPDALRVVVDALRLQAGRRGDEPKEALELATTELANFKVAGDKRGQATMLLTLIKLNTFRRHYRCRHEGLRQGTQCLSLCRELGDRKLEGITFLALTDLRILMKCHAEAMAAANKALAVFKEVGDVRGKAKALHGLGVALFHDGQLAAATRSMKDALVLARSLGSRKLEALELNSIAEVYLEQESTFEALATAKEALLIFQELAQGGGWHVVALDTVVRAHLANNDGDAAVKFLKQELSALREAGNPAAEVEVLALQADALLQSKDPDAALPRAEEALAVAQENGIKRSAAAALHLIARIQYERKDYAEALMAVKEAVQLFRELNEPVGEGVAQHAAVLAHARREKWKDAMKLAIDAKELFRKAGDRHCEARGSLVIGSLHRIEGQGQEAVSAAKEAQALFSEEKDRAWEALSYHEIADIHAWQENFPAASRAAKKALSTVRELDDKANLAVVLSTVGSIKLSVCSMKALENHSSKKPPPWVEQDMLEDATKTIEEAIALCKNTLRSRHHEDWEKERNKLLTFNLFGVAQVNLMMQRTSEALQVVEESQALARKAGEQEQEVITEVLLSYVHLMDQEGPRAVEAADRALELAQRIEYQYGEFLANDVKEAIASCGPGGGGMGVGVSAVGSEGPAISYDIVKYKVDDVAHGLMGIDSLSGDTPLMDAGLDSLSMVEFRNELVKEFPGLEMPGALLFDYPTVNTITEFLMSGLKMARKTLQ